MARSAHLILFVAVAIALFLSTNAYYQDNAKPDQPCNGGPMDQATNCGSQCPLTCEQPEPKFCILSCKLNACECKPGYVRRQDGMCVTKEECKNVTPTKK